MPAQHIAQQYIQPKLDAGYKFDVRVFLCLCSDYSYFLYPKYVVRYASDAYHTNTWNSHITNLSAQPVGARDATKLDSDLSPDLRRMVQKGVPEVVAYLVTMCAEMKIFQVSRKVLFGLDVMFDEVGNPFLLEINGLPAMISTVKWRQELYREVFRAVHQFAFRTS